MGLRRLACLLVVPVAFALASACGSDYSLDNGNADAAQAHGGDGSASSSDPDGSGSPGFTDDSGTDAAVLPECAAQRVVHIVSGGGSFGRFTQLWPVPAVITSFDTTYAYDDPTLATLAVVSMDHPLYARKLAMGNALFSGTGSAPMPSVFLSGTNDTHTSLPGQTRAGATDVIALGAKKQTALGAPMTVLEISGGGLYSSVGGFPTETLAADIDSAVTALKTVTMLSAVKEVDVRPDDTIINGWLGVSISTVDPNLALLARQLLFTANLFRTGLVSTVVLSAFKGDDPHGFFAAGADPTTQTNLLAKVMQGFYARLATSNEPACTHHGAPLASSDNVVLVVDGDTPKNPFAGAQWPDGTPSNTNWIYVRSNGWLMPGWFGQVLPMGTTTFNPTTGLNGAALPAGATAAQNAALFGLAYAITRGDTMFIDNYTQTAYGGVLSPTKP